MKKNESNEVVSLNPLTAIGIEKMILVIRDKQVLLDRDLATLYGVETRVINQAVKRNLERFPERNCFQLTRDEMPDSLKSQIVILNESGNKRGLHVKKMPYAFKNTLENTLDIKDACFNSIEIDVFSHFFSKFSVS